MGVLFDLIQDYGSKGEDAEASSPCFKDFARMDADDTFFNGDEHAGWHTIDGGEKVLVIFEEMDLRERSAHWEAGAKQNFDTGLYTAHAILYIKTEDYGPKPAIGKQLVMDQGTDVQRTYTIKKCGEEEGVFRMILERVRQ